MDGTTNYAPIIDGMTWSYSRARMFDDCPYRWFMRYIRHKKGGDTFFATYGSFIHNLIDRYYKEGLSSEKLRLIYLRDFKAEVKGRAPSEKVYTNWFRAGLDYLKSFTPIPFEPIETEKEVHFKVGDRELIGYIDFLGRDKDGGLVVVDNKSRALKPRSGNPTPTKSDVELDEYLRQLYLYSIPVEEEYGATPKLLCFNCFRTGTFIKEPFDPEAYAKAKEWFLGETERIRGSKEFPPKEDFFKCNYLCECNAYCEYFNAHSRRRGK